MVKDYLPSDSDLSIFALALGSMATEPRSRMSEGSSNAEIRWLLEEVVIAASPSPAGAASVEDDEEMANVASNSEELGGSFIMIVCRVKYDSKMENRRKKWKNWGLKRGILYDAHTIIGGPH